MSTVATYRELLSNNEVAARLKKWTTALTRCWKGPRFSWEAKRINGKIVLFISPPQEYINCFCRFIGGRVYKNHVLYSLAVPAL